LPGWVIENPLRIWKIHSQSIPWGNDVLAKSLPCDVLIIDEIGYLEFEENSGWDKSFEILEEKQFGIAFVVVRESLVGAALSHWEKAKLIEIKSGDNINLISQKILDQIDTILIN